MDVTKKAASLLERARALQAIAGELSGSDEETAKQLLEIANSFIARAEQIMRPFG